MAISARLKGFLENARMPYTVTQHPVVYTAQEIAAAQHVPGRQLAKSVLVITNRGPVLAVLPAIHRVDVKRLKSVLRAAKVSIGGEAQIRQIFPDIEVGAMSVFGQLYQVPVVVDTSLAESREIVCNAGTHAETITVRYADFAAAVKPSVGAFGQSADRGKRKARVALKKRAKRSARVRRPPAARTRTRPSSKTSKPTRSRRSRGGR
jgi:Ala-tRNA(Pro) deacylase